MPDVSPPSDSTLLARVLRIFVSSPGDVGEERLMAERVIGRLQGEFGRSVQLAPYFWEHEPMRATGHFQEQILRPSACDIVVCMLWSRLGTRLPENVSAEGKTGTEWEFEDAADSYRKKHIPDLLVYRKDKTPVASLRDEAGLEEKRRQLKALDAFVKRWFQAEDGTFQAAFKTFGALDEFEAVLESDLRKLIQERVGAAAPERTWHQEPFRGLQAFEYQHAPIFFGRTRAISAVKEQLVQQAARGCAFVLVFGMSGVGKSSLVRAGVLPLLTQPGVIEGIGLWRWCVFRPSDAAADLAGGLAATLTAETALPELQAAGVNTDQLADFLRQAPEQAVLPLRVGLHRAAETVQAAEHLSRPPAARLALVVDQLEELFTLERVDERQRRGFVQALSALARSGLVWVIGTMRSDFYPRCAEVAELAALKEGAGQYDLLPPSAPELQQMIELPARAAGLRFEERQNGERLDHVLHEAASRDPRALPLLEFTLDELYKQVPPDAAGLTFAAYEQLGGMEGALARRAEDEFARLSPAVQAALPAVFRALVTVRTGEAEVVVAQPAPKEKLQADPDQRALVTAFVQARLLVSDKSSAGVPVVRLAHEALLHHWPRLKQWLVKDMDFLRIRARVTEAAAHWQAEGRLPELLLPAGKPLAEGEFLLARRHELDPAVVQYVELSRQRAYRARQRRRLAVAGFVAVLLAGTVLSITFAIQAAANAQKETQQRERAEDKTAEARKEKNRADAKATEAKANEQKADRARKEADKQKRIAELRAKDLEEETANLAILSGHAADNAWEAGRVELARDFLLAVPIKYRGWEWRYRQRRFQGSYATLYGHTGAVNAVAFSPGGQRLASASDDGTVKLWEAVSGKEVLTLRGHGARVSAVAFSPDGQRLASASDDKTVKLWDASSGNELLTLRGHTTEVRAVAFSPDGKHVASASAVHESALFPGEVKLWAVGSGKELFTLRGDTRGATAVAFSPDGQRLAAPGWRSGHARLWAVGSGKELKTLAEHGVYAPLAFSPDGQRLASASFDRTVKLWEAGGGRELLTLHGHTGVVYDVAFSPDGQRLASAGFDKTVKLWDASSGKELLTLRGHASAVNAVAFSPDGQRLASASDDKTVKLWDAGGGKERWNPLDPTLKLRAAAFSADGQRQATVGLLPPFTALWDTRSRKMLFTQRRESDPSLVLGVGLSPDGQRLATASYDGTVKLWDASSGKELLTLRGHTDVLVAVAFSPDGQCLASASGDKTVKLWGARSGKELLTLHGHTDMVVAVAFSPDGQCLASASDDKTVKLWDAGGGRELLTLRGHTNWVTAVAFSPDGQRLASASEDKTVKLWEAGSGKELLTLRGHTNWVTAVAFSPDGQRLASASLDSTLKLWDTGSGKELLTLPGNTYGVTAVSFSPDGQRLAYAKWDGTAKVWRAGSVKEPLTLRGHTDWVTGVAFSPDGQRLASASVDQTARLWDTGSGKELLTLRGHTDSVTAVTFSPDGQRVATAGRDKTIELWDARRGQALLLLRGHTAEVEGVSFSPDGQKLFSRDSSGITLAWGVKTGAPVRPPTNLVFPFTGAGPAFMASLMATSMWTKWVFPFTGGGALDPTRPLLALPVGDRIELIDLSPPTPAEVAFRQGMARFDPFWHRAHAEANTKAGNWFAAAFHWRLLAEHDPGNAEYRKNLEEASTQVKSSKN
jgi:WD40 repeat protein